MREISLNILDVVGNSLAVEAPLIRIDLDSDDALDRLTVVITDDGCGMDASFLQKVTDPFTTSRTTRNVGMGIPLFKMAAEAAGGTFAITSSPGKGTTVRAEFQKSHIDRMPLGDLAGTMVTLVQSAVRSEIVLNYTVNGSTFVFDTREVKAELESASLDIPEVLAFLEEYLRENLVPIE